MLQKNIIFEKQNLDTLGYENYLKNGGKFKCEGQCFEDKLIKYRSDTNLLSLLIFTVTMFSVHVVITKYSSHKFSIIQDIVISTLVGTGAGLGVYKLRNHIEYQQELKYHSSLDTTYDYEED